MQVEVLLMLAFAFALWLLTRFSAAVSIGMTGEPVFRVRASRKLP
jgi:hypothetical protein